MSTATASEWYGWIRLPGQRWESIVTAPSEDEAWRQLRQHVEQLAARFVDTYVGASGVDPNATPKMRRCRF